MEKNGLSAAVLLLAGIAGVQGASATPIPPDAKDFAMALAQSNQYEIMAANVAAVESGDARVRAFAQEMIRDHARLDEDLRKAVMASGLPPPEPAMSSDQASLLSSLQSVRGAEFDKTYARQQELAHVQAIDVVESFATGGGDANLRKAAEAALPVIRDHLKMARQLSADVGAS